jgi:hypothetical protein
VPGYAYPFLDELWEVNQEHVGELILEVEAYYVLTGLRRELTNRRIAWCRRFFERRSAPDRINPMDRGDPFIRFERLQKDFDDILGRVSDMDETVNYIFINECAAFVMWYLFDRTWGRFVEVEPDGHLSLTYEPSEADIPDRCATYLGFYRLLLGDLPLFLRKVRGAAGCRDCLEMIRALPDDTLRSRLDGLMADIQAMRPFLLKGFHPEKASINLGDDLIVAWDWSLRFGLASLIVGTSVEDIRRVREIGRGELFVTVGQDGLLLDVMNPWVTTETITTMEDDRWLPENQLVLELFHEKLFGMYEKIDFERIRRRSEDSAGTVSDDEAIALSIQDLAAAEPDDWADKSHIELAPTPGRSPPITSLQGTKGIMTERSRRAWENMTPEQRAAFERIRAKGRHDFTP